MSIQDWGAIGEIIGAAAVLISLIYLAKQIRQNTRQLQASVEATRLASFESNVRSGNFIRELLVRDREISDLFLRGLKGLSRLDDTDRFRMDMLLRIVFAESQRTYVRERALKSDSEGPQQIIDDLLKSRGVREWLTSVHADWLPESRDFVFARLELQQQESTRDAS